MFKTLLMPYCNHISSQKLQFPPTDLYHNESMLFNFNYFWHTTLKQKAQSILDAPEDDAQNWTLQVTTERMPL